MDSLEASLDKEVIEFITEVEQLDEYKALHEGTISDETYIKILKTFYVMEFSHLKDKVPHYLSGGEKTKVGIAGALAHRPELLILDEPFEGLDPVCRTTDRNKSIFTRFVHTTGNN